MCVLCYHAHLRARCLNYHTVIIIDKDDCWQKSKETQTDKEKKKNEPRIAKSKILPVTERALSSTKKCKQFTGISLHLFNQLLKGLKGKFKNSYKMGPEDQLCLFYCKLKINATNGILATIFGVEE